MIEFQVLEKNRQSSYLESNGEILEALELLLQSNCDALMLDLFGFITAFFGFLQ